LLARRTRRRDLAVTGASIACSQSRFESIGRYELLACGQLGLVGWS